MKQLISLLAALALIASFPFVSFADPAVALNMENVTVEAGTRTVSVSLTAEFSGSVGDGQVTVTFPADKLQLSRAVSPLNAETAVNTRKASEGTVKMGFISDGGLTGTVTLLTLDFVIKNTAEAASYTVSASSKRMSDLNYHNLLSADAPAAAQASVTVTAAQPDPEVTRLKAELSALIGRQIDENLYTAESVASYNTLKEQAAALVESASATAAALQDMIDRLGSALVENPAVDPEVAQLRAQLQELINEEIDEDLYTPESVEDYNRVVQQAITLLQNPSATAARLRSMITIVSTALVNKPEDPEVTRLKEELSALIGRQINGDLYTPESVEAYNALKQQAAALAESDSATAAALQDMIDQLNGALVSKPAADGQIQQLKEELTGLIGETIDEDLYTPESVEAYNGLKEQAAALAQSDSATAAALQDMIDRIRAAYDALEEKQPAASVKPGDVDGDGNITSTDARLTLQVSVDKVKRDDLPVPEAADVDKDGNITSTDARLILQVSVGKIQGFDAL